MLFNYIYRKLTSLAIKFYIYDINLRGKSLRVQQRKHLHSSSPKPEIYDTGDVNETDVRFSS